MAGTHQGKITTIGCQDALELKAFCYGHNRCVDEPNLRVLIPAHQLQAPPKVRDCQLFNFHLTADNRLDQALLGLGSQMKREEIGGLRQDGNRNYEIVARGLEKPDSPMVPIIIPICHRIKWSRVNDYRGH
jgi:hypothetical protein